MEELNAYFGGNRRIAISRELTKKFEENFRGSIAEAIIHFTQKEPKGEFVVVLEGKTKEEHIAISNKEKYGK